MLSKNALSVTRPWSITASLTIWYSLLTFSLVAFAMVYSYWVLTESLDREDDEFVVSRLNETKSRLEVDSADLRSLRILWQGAESEGSQLRIQLQLENLDGKPILVMPGSDSVPWDKSSSRSEPRLESKNGEWRFQSIDCLLPSGEGARLRAALDRRQESAFLVRYRKRLYLVLLVTAFACALGGIFIVRRGLRPLRNLSLMATGISAQNMEERLIADDYASELMQVANTFNRMLDRLRDSFDRLNRFSGDIAHELRSPLNNLRGEVEVVLTKARTDSEYRETLGSCLEETERLCRLVDSLLFLARAENPAKEMTLELLDLDAELRTIVEFYEALADERKVRFVVDCDSNLKLMADRTLLQRAIGNLITNSLAYTPPLGTIEVSGRRVGEFANVVVKDTGLGIDSTDLPKVFDRLHRGIGKRIGSQGSGLGLPIVKTIVEMHAGTVHIESIPNVGTSIETRWRARTP